MGETPQGSQEEGPGVPCAVVQGSGHPVVALAARPPFTPVPSNPHPSLALSLLGHRLKPDSLGPEFISSPAHCVSLASCFLAVFVKWK